ncbi:MAG: sulfite exporter TauE/SafE family protein [Planctomycetes bacterium]|nr:sulfite exporter TauE/SafE family protein [Planctomycetota bacterium]
MDPAATTLPILTSIVDQPALAAKIALLGLAGGLGGGLFGIGGGLVIIPGLTMLLSASIKTFQVAALPVGVSVAGSSVAKHLRTKTVQWRWIRWALPAALAGSWIGSMLAGRLDARVLELLFGCFLAATALRESWVLWRGKEPDANAPTRTAAPIPALALVLGTLMGVLSALLGIGGGILAVPWLRMLGGLPMRPTVATSSTLVLLTSIFATITRIVPILRTDGPSGLQDEALLAACLLPGAVVGGYVGAALVHRLPVRKLAAGFIIVLIVFASRMFVGR